MQFSRVKTSGRSRGILSKLKFKTGLTPNLISRFAICLSLKDASVPNPLEFDEDGTEFLPGTLFGDYDKLFMALMIDRLHRDELDPEKELNKMLRAHLNRGIYSLTSRLQGLDGLSEMIKAEQKYD